MLSFECPLCQSIFTSNTVKNREDFLKYGKFDLNRVEEGNLLKCPKCKNIFKIHLEKEVIKK